jgi:hypothetical protein
MASVAKLGLLVFTNLAGMLQALALPRIKLAQQQLLNLWVHKTKLRIVAGTDLQSRCPPVPEALLLLRLAPPLWLRQALQARP